MTNEKPSGFQVTRPPYVEGGGDPRQKLIPKSVRLEIIEDPRGTPLTNLINAFGGYTGFVTDYFGQAIPASIERWRSADPTKVKVAIQLTYDNRR
jgi:hypothetical protein